MVFYFSNTIGNNKFKIEIKCNEKCYIHDIIIPDGNYDRESLVNYLNTNHFEKSDNDLLEHIKIIIDKTSNKTHFKLSDSAPDDFFVFFTFC